MQSVIFIAPPAAGKGTQSDLLCKKYHIPHISTGDLLREEVNKKTLLGKQIQEKMNHGELVSDDIIYQLIRNRLSKDDCRDGYVLDGFPRNIQQAVEYEQILKDLNKEQGTVILLNISKEEAQKRIVGRLSCSKCGSIYNYLFDGLKPKDEGICDSCGSSLIHRDDDNAETYEKRYQTYLEATEPLIEYYRNKNLLHIVETHDNSMDTFADVEKVIEVFK